MQTRPGTISRVCDRRESRIGIGHQHGSNTNDKQKEIILGQWHKHSDGYAQVMS